MVGVAGVEVGEVWVPGGCGRRVFPGVEVPGVAGSTGGCVGIWAA